jgi:cytochrome P450
MSALPARSPTMPRRAPEVPARFPLEHLIAFGRDPDGFLQRCREAHGDTFTLRLPRRRTFLLDPLDHGALFKSDVLRFDDVALELGSRAFGYDPPAAVGWDMHGLTDLYTLLKGDELATLTTRMNAALRARLAAALSPAWRQDRLYRFVVEHVFAAGVEALFGDGSYSDQMRRAYEVVDRWFGPLTAGVPGVLLPWARRAQRVLTRAVEATAGRAGRARFLDARAAYFEAHGVPRDQWSKLDASIVWASQANTIATAFWLLAFILRDPRARAEILDEVRAAGRLDLEAMKRLPKLDSAVSETTRLTSLALVLRRATVDTTLALAAGPLAVRAGEELCLYARATHLDPEIYADPYSFVFDRFLPGPDGPPRFSRRGEKIPFHLVPFGGGRNACPGRFFARNELKLIVATLLAEYDVELTTTASPDLDFSRVGLGVPPPTFDPPFRVRRRG